MVSLDLLPEELTIAVLNNLERKDVECFIESLKQVEPCGAQKILLIRSLKRLYSGKTVVFLGPSQYETHEYDLRLSTKEFVQKFEIDNFENDIFRSTRPQTLQFDFIRPSNGYNEFVSTLNQFTDIVTDLVIKENPKYAMYFASVHHIRLHIDSRSLLIENPTSVVVAVLKVLINMAGSSNPIRGKLCDLSVESTYLGEHFPGEWNQILPRFNNLNNLKLNDVMISLPMHLNTSLYKSWPPALEKLYLNDNDMSSLPKNLLNELPKSLKLLSLTANRFNTIGYNENEVDLAKVLPNLQLLDLSRNRFLAWINPKLFENCINLKLGIMELVLDTTNMQDLAKCELSSKISLVF